MSQSIRIRPLLAVVVTVTLGAANLSNPPAAAADMHEQHHHAEPSGLVLNHGQKWSTDAPLRQSMEAIRQLAIQTGPAPTPEQATVLADGIRDQVRNIVTHCKLEPRADAVLHVLLARLITGADHLTKPDTRSQGLDVVQHILRQYPEYFGHPDW